MCKMNYPRHRLPSLIEISILPLSEIITDFRHPFYYGDLNSCQVFNVLKAGHEKAPEDTELLWRFIRAHFDRAEQLPKESRQPLLTEALKVFIPPYPAGARKAQRNRLCASSV